MKQRNLFILVVLVVVVGLLLAAFGCAGPSATTTPSATAGSTLSPKPTTTGSQPPAQQTVIKWNAQTNSPPTSSYTIRYGPEWAEWVKKATGGRLVVEYHPTGTFAPADKMLDVLSKGAYDVALDFAGYYPETIPISNVESGLPMAWKEAFEVHDAFYNRGLFDLVKEAYAEYNVIPLGVAYDASTWYHFGTSFTFNSLDDIKGKKIRALGIYGKYTAALGGVPTVIPTGDVYMALKTGIIDGMIMGISTIDSYKLGEILKYYVFDPTLTPLVTVAPKINKDSWDKLPADIKSILEDSRYYFAEAAFRYKIDSLKTLTGATKTYGMKFVKLSPEDEQKARNAAIPLWDNVAKMDARAAKGVEIIKQQMKDYGRI